LTIITLEIIQPKVQMVYSQTSLW